MSGNPRHTHSHLKRKFGLPKAAGPSGLTEKSPMVGKTRYLASPEKKAGCPRGSKTMLVQHRVGKCEARLYQFG